MLHSFNIDLVVLFVRANELDEQRASAIHHCHDEPVVVAFDVEDDTVIADKTCIAKVGLDVGWGFPVGAQCFCVPAL